MAANMSMPPPPLAERAEIHKSCKALEAVVNLLNDYCEAATAVVQLQKRLAKAIKEAAQVKCNSDAAVVALGASATIFEALAEVDAKFAKVADKECDWISGEVKKWFKKLAKEEKAHDERMTSSNAKIKAAGQNYETKAKKNTRDAGEAHARYIQLLTTLGPELTQEKYNHAAFVSQRHTAATFSVAISLAKVSDAEWLRSCENVRRFAPVVGRLAEARAFCEGGWAQPMPDALPDPDAEPARGLRMPATDERRHLSDAATDATFPRTPDVERQPPKYAPPETDMEPMKTAPETDEHAADNASLHAPSLQPRNKDSSTSLASLASFPAPPTHFPLPPVNGPPKSATEASERTSAPISPARSNSGGTLVDMPQPAPAPAPAPANSAPNGVTPSKPERPELPPLTSSHSSSGGQLASVPEDGSPDAKHATNERPTTDFTPYRNYSASPAGTMSSATSAGQAGIGAFKRGDYVDDKEFGVRGRGEPPAKARTMDAPGAKIDRSDSANSTGSVNVMRSRYSNTPASPPPRDMPRLPQSVTALASRYQDTASPVQRATSPGEGPSSPTGPRYRSLDLSPTDRPGALSPASEEIHRRRQRIEELEELQLRERELELRQRERELERDRVRLYGTRGTDPYSDASARYPAPGATRSLSSQNLPLDAPSSPSSRYPAPGTATRTLSSQNLLLDTPSSPTPRYPYSTSHLAAPADPAAPPAHARTPSPRRPDHAPSCGCATCSASQYRARDPSPSPHDLRPPEPPIQLRAEKPKGWMRRLSMPVGFSTSDRTRKVSGGLQTPTTRSRNSFALPEDARFDRASYEQSNRSVASLVGGRR